MINLLVRWLINAVALFLVSRILPGFIVDDFAAAMIAVIIIGLVNALIKPILAILTLPINILTLGLFSFILNALLLLLASSMTPGFHIDGFGTALLGSILLSVVTMLLQSIVR